MDAQTKTFFDNLPTPSKWRDRTPNREPDATINTVDIRSTDEVETDIVSGYIPVVRHVYYWRSTGFRKGFMSSLLYRSGNMASNGDIRDDWESASEDSLEMLRNRIEEDKEYE